jgi:hypothetical protein
VPESRNSVETRTSSYQKVLHELRGLHQRVKALPAKPGVSISPEILGSFDSTLTS